MLKWTVLAVVLSGCGLYSDGDGDPGPAPLDAPADAAPATCEPSPDRNISCRSTVCTEAAELCPGADWTVCFEECRAGVADVAWCPGLNPL